MKTIDSFWGPHWFLSNFYPSGVPLPSELLHSSIRDDFHFSGPLDCKTVEHGYQAAKCCIADDVKEILATPTPKDAKRIGRRTPLRPDWEWVKVGVMHTLLRFKFSNPALQDRLIRTYPKILIEGNTWGDRFWGVDGDGHNMLGNLLMQVRMEVMTRD